MSRRSRAAGRQLHIGRSSTPYESRERERRERQEQRPRPDDGYLGYCPAHLLPEPCPTCSAYIAGGL